MSVKERVKEFLNNQNITISVFEKSINASNGYVNSISKSIGIDKINIILEKYPNLNIEWLLTGKGEMLKKPETSNIVSEPQTSYEKKSNENEIIAMQKKLLESQAREIELLHEKIERLEDIKSISTKTT